MKKVLLSLLALLPLFSGFAGYMMRENGLANISQADGTGSPFTTNSCDNCHMNGSFSPNISLTVTDTFGTPTSTYTPGQHYILSFKISTTGGAPAGFGMQAIVLDSEDTFAGHFYNPDAQSQISMISNREYAEHAQLHTDSVFTYRWRAPQQLSGNLTFFFVGLAANGNGNPNLDNMAPQSTLVLTEYCPPAVPSTQSVTICSGSSFSYNGHVYNTSGLYADTLEADNGCDSIMHTTLTVSDTLFATLNAEICQGQSYTNWSTPLTTAGTYHDTLTAAAGCDSVVTLALVVNQLPQVNFVTPDTLACLGDNPFTLVANPPGGTFSGTLVSGNEFDPATAGIYEVIYTYADANNCQAADTITIEVAICDNVTPAVFPGLRFSPNPFSKSMQLSGLPANAIVTLIDATGKTRFVQTLRSETATITPGLPAGMYLLTIESGDRKQVERVIITH